MLFYYKTPLHPNSILLKYEVLCVDTGNWLHRVHVEQAIYINYLFHGFAKKTPVDSRRLTAKPSGGHNAHMSMMIDLLD